MNYRLFRMACALGLMLIAHVAYAQKELVVVADDFIEFKDPLYDVTAWIDKGYALRVFDNGGDTYHWEHITMSKSYFHVPGTVEGEHYIVVNGTNVRFLKNPSAKADVFCYDRMNLSYGSHVAFVEQDKVKRIHTDSDGIICCWEPSCLPKGTRLPYKGKVGDFYKTAFDGHTLYISAKHSYLR